MNDWHDLHGHFTRERTYLGQQRDGRTTPAWVRPGQRWWYTHDRLRRAYRLLAKFAQRGHLFTYLDPAHDGLDTSSSTNQAEGAISAGLRDMLRRHRGMLENHQPPAPAATPLDETIGPATYDTGLTAEEGL